METTILGLGHDLGSGGLGFRIQIQGPSFRVWGLGFRGLGFRGSGLIGF